MATGNVGYHLSDKEDEVNTFFSRDAGLTWAMARTGSHIYEYGDHGAILVIADDRKASTEAYYSWDESLTWNDLHFSDTPVEIENIVIEPQATSQVFIMYGTRGEAGVIFQVDFSQQHERKCKGVSGAGDPTSDYELWSPSDGRSGGTHCLLGHQVRYTRRRRAAQCFNGEQFERSEFRKNCPCAEDDYECDFGYERATDGGPCVAVMAVSQVAPNPCSGTYSISNGYRLVAGDTCDPKAGIDHLPTVYSCPGLFSGSSSEVSGSGWTVLFVLLLLLGVLAVVTLRSRHERIGMREVMRLFRQTFSVDGMRYLCRSLSLGSAVSAVQGLVSAVGGLFGGGGPKYGRVPDSAIDDELDMGDEDMEEAEELRDGDAFAAEAGAGRLGTAGVGTLGAGSMPAAHRTPHGKPQSATERLNAAAATGSLLGEEYTSPRARGKGD